MYLYLPYNDFHFASAWSTVNAGRETHMQLRSRFAAGRQSWQRMSTDDSLARGFVCVRHMPMHARLSVLYVVVSHSLISKDPPAHEHWFWHQPVMICCEVTQTYIHTYMICSWRKRFVLSTYLYMYIYAHTTQRFTSLSEQVHHICVWGHKNNLHPTFPMMNRVDILIGLVCPGETHLLEQCQGHVK